MKRVHWVIVALVCTCVVVLPPWFSMRGAGALAIVTAPAGAARRVQGGNLRSGGGRVYVGGGSRAGK